MIYSQMKTVTLFLGKKRRNPFEREHLLFNKRR